MNNISGTRRTLSVEDMDEHFLNERLIFESQDKTNPIVHVFRIPTDSATAGYIKVPVAGKAFWIRQNSAGVGTGALLNRIAFNNPPTDVSGGIEELRQSLPLTNGMLLSTPFKSLWVKVATTAASGFIDIAIFKHNSSVSSFDPSTGGGIQVTTTSALPVYMATPTTTTESSAPMYLSPNGTTTAMDSAAYARAPAADTAQVLSVVDRKHIVMAARTSATLGSGATFTGTTINLLTDAGGGALTPAANSGVLSLMSCIGAMYHEGGTDVTVRIQATLGGTANFRNLTNQNNTSSSSSKWIVCMGGAETGRVVMVNGVNANTVMEMSAGFVGSGAVTRSFDTVA